MEIVKDYKNEQRKSVEILNKLDEFLMHGQDMGVHIDKNLREKIAKVVSEIENQKLRVALIGGFSEGKTSIAAAWLEKYDKESMKIDHKESSDEVIVYDIENDLELIDTPGLFGFKEKMDTDSQTEEKYKDITKKYISEAHLLLYVMNAQNPIKESHKAELIWLFRELNLLNRTVFVFSKFDSIADIEDKEDFEEMFQIKKQNVETRLCEILGLTPQEQESLSIVAVSANPFDKGMDYWLEHKDNFKKMSHIKDLQDATLKKIQQNGGNIQIVEETKKSVIQDIINRILPNAIQENIQMQKSVDECIEYQKNINSELDNLKLSISSIQIELRKFVTDYFTSLIRKLNGTSLDSFKDFFDEEIGKDGIIVNTKIQNVYQEKIGIIAKDIQRIEGNFEENNDVFNSVILGIGKKGIDYLSKSGVINAQNILIVRDGIANAAKFIGADLGGLLKFKPWGATKFAGGLSAAFGAISLGLEIFDQVKKQKQEQDFMNAVEEMRIGFEDQRETLLNDINSDDFISNFPGYSQLISEMARIDQIVEKARERQIAFNDWTKIGEIIDAEYTEIKALQ